MGKNPKFNKSLLQAGDALLYFENDSLLDWAIAIKTGGRIAHIEIYAGGGISEASRNGIGVNRYALRLERLACVRRPDGWLFDFEQGSKWFDETARGQKYDFKGLLCFYLAVKRGDKDRMFCSEFALRRYRHCGFQPFNPDQDADRTAPYDFWKSGKFETFWKSGNP